jgi:hypothetical protein
LGCYGPTPNVGDFGAKALTLITSIAQEDPETLGKILLDPAGMFNRFSLGASTLKQHIEDVEG